jgi:hypothetical protein
VPPSVFRLLIGEYQHPPLPEHGSMLGARPASVNGHAACTTVCCLTGYRCSLEEPLFQNLLKGAHGALLHVGEHVRVGVEGDGYGRVS